MGYLAFQQKCRILGLGLLGSCQSYLRGSQSGPPASCFCSCPFCISADRFYSTSLKGKPWQIMLYQNWSCNFSKDPCLLPNMFLLSYFTGKELEKLFPIVLGDPFELAFLLALEGAIVGSIFGESFFPSSIYLYTVYIFQTNTSKSIKIQYIV